MHKVEFNDIPKYDTWNTIKKIHIGWSNDIKYYIKDNIGKEYCLRVSDISEYDKKYKEFEVIKMIYKTGVNMSKPISFGMCNNEKNVYILLTWINGEQAELVLPLLSLEEQYNLGFKAGMTLKRIHQVDSKKDIESWEEYFNKKIDYRIDSYNKCGIKNDNVDKMIEYINDNRHIIKDRKQCLNHGDYHIGNLIIDDKLNISVIDFNRSSYGDPIDEFNRIAISSKVSSAFSSGQINGYFNNKASIKDFKLMKFYILATLIGTIPWALNYEESDLVFALESINVIFDNYDGLKSLYPSWYKK